MLIWYFFYTFASTDITHAIYRNFLIMKNLFLKSCLWAFVALTAISCKKEMFDMDAYHKLIEESSPIGSIDPNHDWKLLKAYTVQLNVGADIDVSYVQVLSYLPGQKDSVIVLAETAAKAGEQKTLSFHAPLCLSEFQAAILKPDGTYLLKTFAAGETIVNLDTNLVKPNFVYNKDSYQTYTYCFEDSYPRPSIDWDYNDLVLRVQKLRSANSDEVRLAITVAAVGGMQQLAAAICLKGFRYEDVVSVATEENRTFDNNYNLKRQFIEKVDLLQKSLNGDAVLNLFEDAHWVMSPRLREDGTGVIRMYYNTQRTVDGTTSAHLRAKTLTYVVKFKDPQKASELTLEKLDVFALAEFNSGRWEIHTFDYKPDGVFRDYGENETAKNNLVVWALKIPSGSFRWPQEGVCMGYFRDGILTGAYMQDNHSYGQWVSKCSTSTDWFYYPSTGLVF